MKCMCMYIACKCYYVCVCSMCVRSLCVYVVSVDVTCVDMCTFQTHQKNNFPNHSSKHYINSIQCFLSTFKCCLWYCVQPNCSYYEAIEVENDPRTYHNECCQDEYLKSGQVNYTKSSGEELSHMYKQEMLS